MVVQSDSFLLRGIPEFYESQVAECLSARTESLATFREMGPPDLCHVLKYNPKIPGKEYGSYHYVLGVDTSSSATIAAYLNSLTYSLSPVQGKPSPWKIKFGTFCCFNAFSRVDIRVEVKIPGGVDCYLVDLRGDRHPISNPAIWQETFVSAVVRSILDDNDEADGNDGVPLLGLRKLDPLSTRSMENKFLEGARAEFWKGWQLGTEPQVQVATVFSNHLTNSIMKYFSESGRLIEAAAFFEPMLSEDHEVAAVLARSYIGTDEEISAIEIMNSTLSEFHISYGVLISQIDFLRIKKKYDIALKLAKLAVVYAPSEYVTWAKLTELYTDVGDYESALLSLNSCPMFTYCEKDAQKMPPPARTHLPLKPEQASLKGEDTSKIQAISGSILDENDPRENEVHPELARLPSLSLRGTFMMAYSLLIKIVSRVGWDDLLKHRSRVFVMEDEYRIHRALVEEMEKTGIHDDNSTSKTQEEHTSGMQNIPLPNHERRASIETSKSQSQSSRPSIDVNSILKNIPKKESPSSSNETAKKGKIPNPRLNAHRVSFSFKNKRLCEKWLDNLFMVLYNDLRLYTALKQEIGQYRAQSSGNSNVLLYRKTGAEWEIYGALAERLDHPEDAKEAYRLCLTQKFSVKAWLRLCEMASEDGNIQETLQAAIKLAHVSDRTYSDITFPSPVGRCIFRVIKKHGLAKVMNVMISLNAPQSSYRLITRYFEYAELFKVMGADCKMPDISEITSEGFIKCRHLFEHGFEEMLLELEQLESSNKILFDEYSSCSELVGEILAINQNSISIEDVCKLEATVLELEQQVKELDEITLKLQMSPDVTNQELLQNKSK